MSLNQENYASFLVYFRLFKKMKSSQFFHKFILLLVVSTSTCFLFIFTYSKSFADLLKIYKRNGNNVKPGCDKRVEDFRFEQ